MAERRIKFHTREELLHQERCIQYQFVSSRGQDSNILEGKISDHKFQWGLVPFNQECFSITFFTFSYSSNKWEGRED